MNAVGNGFGAVRHEPFVHMIAEDWLKRDLYRRLIESFPSCPPASGPTGFTLFWGDPAYDRLIAEEAAWGELFELFHSQAFVDRVVQAVSPVLALEGRVDLSRARYVPYRESRRDKQRSALARVEHAPDELWVRMDIMQGHEGYFREAHLDHRRRLASMLIYLCDAEENGMVGGDLVLHGSSGDVVIRPRHNRMVLFPCHNASLHSVTPIVSQRALRSFVQVTVSSSVDIWKSLPGPPLWKRAAARLRLATR